MLPPNRPSRVVVSLVPNICSRLRCGEPAPHLVAHAEPEVRAGGSEGKRILVNLEVATAAVTTARPYYVTVGNEESVFKAAYHQGLSVLLKGPTGCGKTRFVEAMAHDLDRPLITVACHDDLTTADLVGRFLLRGGETEWVDGPLTRAVRLGAICYLDEVVEARQDTTVVLHPLADHRRQLPIDRLGVTLEAAPGFGLVMSYNPGYQSVLKDLKDSTRQRMVAIEFTFPEPDVEERIVSQEAGVDDASAKQLVRFAQAIRRLETGGLREVASTRVLIAAGRLIAAGLSPAEAARAGIAGPLTDDPSVTRGLIEMVDLYFAADGG
jgi:nitric oxide reductase NorQ protein